MSYTEFVKAEHILRKFRHAQAKLTYQENERPVVFQIYGDHPGLHPSMGDAFRMALHWWAENKDEHPVYYVSLSQLVRDALSVYAKYLSPKVLREESSTSSPETVSSEVSGTSSTPAHPAGAKTDV